MKYTYIHYPTKDGKVLLFVTNGGYFSGDISQKKFEEKDIIVKAIIYKPEPVETIFFTTEEFIQSQYVTKNQLLKGGTYFNVPLCSEAREEINELEKNVFDLVLEKKVCIVHYFPSKKAPERFIIESLT